MRFSVLVQTGPRAHSASYTKGTGSFPGVEQPGRDVDHSLPSRAEVKEGVELYFWDFMASFRANFTFIFYLYKLTTDKNKKYTKSKIYITEKVSSETASNSTRASCSNKIIRDQSTISENWTARPETPK